MPRSWHAGPARAIARAGFLVARRRSVSTPLVAAVWALAVGIVTLWLDGPLEARCVDLGTTPQELTARITALLTGLLTGQPPRGERGG